MSLKSYVGAWEQGISSASAVYLWQRIKDRKIKYLLISPEKPSFFYIGNIHFGISFFVCRVNLWHHIIIPNLKYKPQGLKDLMNNLRWILKLLSFNYEIAWLIAQFIKMFIWKPWKLFWRNKGDIMIFPTIRWEQCTLALSICGHWSLLHSLMCLGKIKDNINNCVGLQRK